MKVRKTPSLEIVTVINVTWNVKQHYPYLLKKLDTGMKQLKQGRIFC